MCLQGLLVWCFLGEREACAILESRWRGWMLKDLRNEVVDMNAEKEGSCLRRRITFEKRM